MCRDERWQNMSKNNFSCQHSWFLMKIVYAWEGDEKEILCQQSKKRSDADIEENMAWNMRLDGEAVRLISESLKRNLRKNFIDYADFWETAYQFLSDSKQQKLRYLDFDGFVKIASQSKSRRYCHRSSAETTPLTSINRFITSYQVGSSRCRAIASRNCAWSCR